MLYAILTIILLLSVYLPSVWVRYVMRKHSQPVATMPGTGGELAQHLIQRFQLDGVKIEELPDDAKVGDHYDPQAQVVRLQTENFNGKSLTAVAVAAHEVGHAIQFHRNEPVSQLRKKYIPLAMMLKKLGIFLMTLSPILAIIIKAPAVMFLMIGISVGLQLLGALAYLVVLPEEWDASFNKALPILLEGEYVGEQDLLAARSVLQAAALTYLAGALADIVNIGRWLLILRR